MTTGFLFGGPSPVVESPRPATAEPRLETPAADRSFGPDVRRVIERTAGPFRREVVGGGVDEYRVLELRNGAIVEETTPGERRFSPLTPELVASGLASGLYREVSRW